MIPTGMTAEKGTVALLGRDEDNHWKRGFLMLVAFVGLVTFGFTRWQGGFEDGVCSAYEHLDASDRLTIKNLPEYCS